MTECQFNKTGDLKENCSPCLPLFRDGGMRAYLNNDAPFIIAQSNVIGPSQAGHTPYSLHSIIQSTLKAIGA